MHGCVSPLFFNLDKIKTSLASGDTSVAKEVSFGECANDIVRLYLRLAQSTLY